MRINLSIVAAVDKPEEEKLLANELLYIEKLLTNSMGFTKIRDSGDGAFNTRVISYYRKVNT